MNAPWSLRNIANTDLKVSPLGLGTVKLGRDKGVKYPNAFTIPDDAAATSLINLAKELGINLIDTAPAYGNSEQRLGQLLKGQRHDWLICSKVGEEFENGESFYDFSAKHTRLSIERSLKRLNTDYIDMVLIHSDGNDIQALESGALEELQRCKQEGLVRAIGASTKTVEGGLVAAKESDIVMLTHNLAYQGEQQVLDYCAAINKAAFIKKAFASGHIQQDSKSNSGTTDPIQASMDFLFAKRNQSTNAGISSAIIGTINPKHLRQNIEKALISLEKPD